MQEEFVVFSIVFAMLIIVVTSVITFEITNHRCKVEAVKAGVAEWCVTETGAVRFKYIKGEEK